MSYLELIIYPRWKLYLRQIFLTIIITTPWSSARTENSENTQNKDEKLNNSIFGLSSEL